MTRTRAALLLVALAMLGASACGKVYEQTASPATARRPALATAATTATTDAAGTSDTTAATVATRPVESTTSTAGVGTSSTGQGPGTGIIPPDAVPTDAPGVWEHDGTYYGTCQAIRTSPYADRPSLCAD